MCAHYLHVAQAFRHIANLLRVEKGRRVEIEDLRTVLIPGVWLEEDGRSVRAIRVYST